MEIDVLTNHQNTIYTDVNMDYACYVLLTLINLALTVGGSLVVVFLWLRQRVFYIHPSLNVLNNFVVKCISSGIIAIWFLYYLSIFISYLIVIENHYDQRIGCIHTDKSYDAYLSFIVSWSVLSAFMQTVLLGLFIHPIYNRALWRGQNNDGNSKLMKRVKKAIIFTFISLITDVLTTVFAYTVNCKGTNEAVFGLTLNLVINHSITIACFDHWRNILWPWNFKSRDTLQQKNKNEVISSNPTGLTQEQNNQDEGTN